MSFKEGDTVTYKSYTNIDIYGFICSDVSKLNMCRIKFPYQGGSKSNFYYNKVMGFDIRYISNCRALLVEKGEINIIYFGNEF